MISLCSKHRGWVLYLWQVIPNIVTYENWTILDGQHIELSSESKVGLSQRGHLLQAQSSGAISQLVVQNLNNPIKLESYNIFLWETNSDK